MSPKYYEWTGTQQSVLTQAADKEVQCVGHWTSLVSV